MGIGTLLNLAAGVLSQWRLPTGRGGLGRAAGKKDVGPFVRRFYLYFLVMFVWTGMYDTTWSLYMHWLGASRWLIGRSFTFFALPLMLFNLWGGRVADRVSVRHRSIVLGTAFQAVTVALYIIVRSPWLAIVVSMIEAGTMSFTGPALSAQVMDAAFAHMRGAVQGIFQAVGTLGAATLRWSAGRHWSLGPTIGVLPRDHSLSINGAVRCLGLGSFPEVVTMVLVVI